MPTVCSSLIVQQIVKSYEEFHLSVEDIATDHDELSVTEIKMMLMQYSKVYRDALKEASSGDVSKLNDSGDDFTQDDLQTANAVIVETMRSADDPHLKARMAIYVREDKKGRKDTLKNLTKIGVDLHTFNQHMRRAFANSAPQNKPLNDSLEDVKKAVVEI